MAAPPRVKSHAYDTRVSGSAAQPALLIVDIIRLLRLRELKLNGLKLIERNPWLGGCDTVSACCKHRADRQPKCECHRDCEVNVKGAKLFN